MKILVKSDVFNICNRIKKFDASYYIVFDNALNKYQIYSSKLTQVVELISGRVLSYVSTIPYAELDVRTLQYLYDTSIENLDKLIDRLDADNQMLEQTNQLKLKQQSLMIAENKLRQLT